MHQTQTKAAFKVALSVSLAIVCALWLQWEKPYWSGMAAFLMGMNESFGHAVKKGRHRILGTTFGAILGITLIALFPQDRFLFLFSANVILAVAVFMASHRRYGYIGTTSLIMCFIIIGSGGFDGQTTLAIFLYRLQETFLGIIIHALVHRLLWPSDTEEAFFALFSKTKKNLLVYYEDLSFNSSLNGHVSHQSYTHSDNSINIQKLYELLSIPLKGSYRLLHHHHQWKDRVKAMSVMQYYMIQLRNSNDRQIETEEAQILQKSLTYLRGLDSQSDDNLLCPKPILEAYDDLPVEAKSDFVAKKNYLLDASRALRAVIIFTTSLILWIYIPIPDGSMFPMNAGIYACVIGTMPDKLLKHWLLGYLIFGLIFIAEYVFILPMMTEVWQLASFYFINMFLIWRIFATPNLVIHRIIGGNMLMLMTLSALHLTPTYDVEASLTMLMHMMFSLLVIQFYTRLFSSYMRQIS